jgi:hypothetical protein
LVAAKPELKNVEPFKTVLSRNREAIAKLSTDDLLKILAATLTGMSVDQFKTETKSWLNTAQDPRWKRPYTDLTYFPMIELLKFLRANSFKTYIVTGGGQDFCPDVCAGGLRHSARASRRDRRRDKVRLRQERQAVSHEGTQVAVER